MPRRTIEPPLTAGCGATAQSTFSREVLTHSIPYRFEQMVHHYPQQLAVKDGQATLTYAELNTAANQLAHAIHAARGAAEEPVALLLEHGLSAIVAIFGILKAGKAYIPIDLAMPQATIADLLRDSQAPLIVTNDRNFALATTVAGQNQGLDRPTVLNLDQVLRTGEAQSTANLNLPIAADRLAMILYTSGSTGQPKGVMNSHRFVLHQIWCDTNGYHICAADRLIAPTSFSYGVSKNDIFGSLLNGAALILFDLKTQGLAQLADLLLEEEITIYRGAATTFRHFVNTLTNGQTFPTLRLIRLGGETIYRRDVELFKQHFPPICILRVGLASTEANTIATCFIDHTTQINAAVVPTGYAAKDKEILILDEQGQPVGLGQVGQIAVRSAYLATGYWRQPALTQAQFLPDPEGGDKRIYLTGDLGQLGADGLLEHFGRQDSMVKIRGHRIELGAVESALLEMPKIKAAAVNAWEDANRNKHLVAYMVPAATPPALSTVRAALQSLLPEHMIPTYLMWLDELPRLPNGKIDRKALPPPTVSNQWQRPEVAVAYQPPRTPLEEHLVTIWQTVLGIEPVGVDDHFLDLGGNSLRAMQIHGRLVNQLQVDLPVRLLFESATIAELALLLTQHAAKQVDATELEQLLVTAERQVYRETGEKVS